MLSVAAAETGTAIPETVEPLMGEVKDVVGGVVSAKDKVVAETDPD
jgi:hypothetical protein